MLRGRPFDFNGGQEDVFGPGYFFRLRRDPVFFVANNTKRIVELFLSWIFFPENSALEFFFEKSSCPPPFKNQMVASYIYIYAQLPLWASSRTEWLRQSARRSRRHCSCSTASVGFLSNRVVKTVS